MRERKKTSVRQKQIARHGEKCSQSAQKCVSNIDQMIWGFIFFGGREDTLPKYFVF